DPSCWQGTVLGRKTGRASFSGPGNGSADLSDCTWPCSGPTVSANQLCSSASVQSSNRLSSDARSCFIFVQKYSGAEIMELPLLTLTAKNREASSPAGQNSFSIFSTSCSATCSRSSPPEWGTS